jgi:hypothetical protein
MAFTYDLSTAIGQVRFLVPDNDATAYDLEDAEITYLLGQVGNVVSAAAVRACRWLARKYAKKASFTADGLTVHYHERAAQFATRAKELEAEIGSGGLSSVEITREDGYADVATESEYERQAKIVYIDL